MNYLKEINFFYEWLETNPISDSAIVLWHALMHINNRAGWIVEFTVAMSTLQTKTGLKKDAIIRARDTLQQSGRIVFRSRSGPQSAVYRIISFDSEKQIQTTNQDDSVVKTDTKRAHGATQTASIIKLEETKDNNPPLSISPQNLKGEGESEPDISILEPVAMKLFGQSNHQILENLWKNIREFRLDAEIVTECLGHTDAQEIKFNPYGYFRGKYTLAMAIVAKRADVLAEQKQFETWLNEQDELSVLAEADCRSPDEIIAEIWQTLGKAGKKGIKGSIRAAN